LKSAVYAGQARYDDLLSRWSLHILRHAVAERPVLRKHLDQINKNVLRAEPRVFGQALDDPPIEPLLLRLRAGVADGELDDISMISKINDRS
jgi:hypothetical protein